MANLKEEWKQVCRKFCKANGYDLVFVNDTSFGFMDKDEHCHHVYVDELQDLLQNK